MSETFTDLICSLANGTSNDRVEAKLNIDLGSGLLQHSKGLDNWQGHPFRGAVPNGKVHHGTECLSSIVLLSGYLHERGM